MNSRILLAALVVSQFVCQQVHAQDEDEPEQAEVTELEGTWEVVADVDNGEQQENGEQCVRFEGNRCYMRVDKDAEWILSATISIDPSAMPAEIGFEGAGEGGGRVETLWGIYKIDNGELTICLGKAEDRPNEFKSSEDYPTLLLVFRRVEDE